MCVGEWSSMGVVKDSDLTVAATLPDIDGEDEDLGNDWDAIDKDTYWYNVDSEFGLPSR